MSAAGRPAIEGPVPPEVSEGPLPYWDAQVSEAERAMVDRMIDEEIAAGPPPPGRSSEADEEDAGPPEKLAALGEGRGDEGVDEECEEVKVWRGVVERRSAAAELERTKAENLGLASERGAEAWVQYGQVALRQIRGRLQADVEALREKVAAENAARKAEQTAAGAEIAEMRKAFDAKVSLCWQLQAECDRMETESSRAGK